MILWVRSTGQFCKFRPGLTDTSCIFAFVVTWWVAWGLEQDVAAMTGTSLCLVSPPLAGFPWLACMAIQGFLEQPEGKLRGLLRLDLTRASQDQPYLRSEETGSISWLEEVEYWGHSVIYKVIINNIMVGIILRMDMEIISLFPSQVYFPKDRIKFYKKILMMNGI